MESRFPEFDELHRAWDAFVYEYAKMLHIPQILDWMTKVLNSLSR